MCISPRTSPRAFQMQEARSAAYFTHYTNLFGSLSHQALARDSLSLWLMWLQMMLHWSLLKFTTCITRTLTWGSLKDNSVCCQIFWTAALADIASKPWRSPCRVRTLLAAAPLAFSMFSDWGRQAGEDLSRKPCYHCNWGNLGPFLPSDASKPTWDDLLCPSSTSTIGCSSMSTRIWRMDWDLPTIARQFVDANERRRRFFGTVHSPHVQWHPPCRATGVKTVLDLLD